LGQVVLATQILTTLGIFLVGAGVVWFVIVYKARKSSVAAKSLAGVAPNQRVNNRSTRGEIPGL
jgi:hypothetical protein